MTFKQLERISEALKELENLKKAPNAKSIYHLNENLSNFLGKDFQMPSLIVSVNIMYNSNSTKEDMLSDIERIKSTLEGMIAQRDNYALANELIDIISEGKLLNDDSESRQKFIAKVFYAYNDVIKFDKSIEGIAKKSIEYKSSWDFLSEQSEYVVNIEVLQGVIHKLKLYAESLLTEGEKKKTTQKMSPVVINNSPVVNATANVTNEVSIDISIVFNNARQQAEDSGLPDEQYKALMEKIDELETIAKSKETKGKRWGKIKEVMKWLVEQGIQVAGILLPAMAQSIV